jgi:hypothetical protein
MLLALLRRSAVVLALSVTFTLPATAAIRKGADAVPLDVLGSLPSFSRTGVLYDRVVPIARLDLLDGSADAPIVTTGTWRQAWDEIQRASLATPTGPDLDALDADARAARRDGVVPLAILDFAFERIRPQTMTDGSLRIENGRIAAVARSPLIESRAFAAATLTPHTYRGDVTFRLAPEAWLSDSQRPRAIEFDFADGLGFRPVAFNQNILVRYHTTGSRVLTARVTRADGSTALSRFRFDVERVTAAPPPDDTLHVTASVAYQGVNGTGDAYVYRAPGHAVISNPVVVIEGLDFYNEMNWEELYTLLNVENLLETLRAEGFDVVVLNFTDATVPVQQNSFVVAELIQQVQDQIHPLSTLAVVGASMGGVCSRYALAWMENHAIPHRVRTWLSFDAPHGGADIPLGMQYWIHFFAGQSADAAAFEAILQRPAARQLLLNHFTVPAGATGVPDPLRASLLADLAAIGDYPTQPRRVAIANGSATGQNQGFAPGAQLIGWEYTSFLVDISGNVWAIPSGSATIFRGRTRVLLSTTSQTVNASNTPPWDGAPGGSRASMAELDAVAAPYGDITAFHPSHAFIPTVSALAIATDDPFLDIAAEPTPFDALYKPVENQPHVQITPENAVWVRTEIEQGVLAAPSPDTGPLALRAFPNPFAGASRFSFTLPREGRVSVKVFGVDGRETVTLADGPRAAGTHTIAWNGRDAHGARVPAGVYFVRVSAPDRTQRMKLVRLD